MFRNYLAAALRNLVRNRLYAVINIVGLAVGLTAALLIALFVREQMSYDRWLPDHGRTFLLTSISEVSGRAPDYIDSVPAELAPLLKSEFPSIETIGRIASQQQNVRRGEIEANERAFWADPSILSILKLPVVAGDLTAALAQPDGLVITQRMARKYFGKDNPIGETLEINRKATMTVRAVIKDLPSNTHLNFDMLAAGQNTASPLAQIDKNPPARDSFGFTAYIYLKLSDSAAAGAIQADLPDFLKRAKSLPASQGKITLLLLPITSVHMAPGSFGIMKPRGDRDPVLALTAIGVLIVFAAGINFVNLMTARAFRRACEVGVRKAMGAERVQIVAQFVGESLIYAGAGMAGGLMLASLLLPEMNTFLDSTIQLGLLTDITSSTFIVTLVFLIGALAGLYPALVLSSFRPAIVLKATARQDSKVVGVRRILVVLQFAMLTGLLVATAVIYRQTQYALDQSRRFAADGVVGIVGPCRDAFKDAIGALPGVRAVTCSSIFAVPVQGAVGLARAKAADGALVNLQRAPVGFGFFEFYGLKPIAGRLFAQDRPADTMPVDRRAPTQGAVVLNETAVRRLGYTSPQDAVGKMTSVQNGAAISLDTGASEIIGVVKDFTADAVHKPVSPLIYYVRPNELNVTHVRFDGARAPEVISGIDALWKKLGDARPINRYFAEQAITDLYADITRQGVLFAIFSGVAIFIAAIGLLGLSAFTAELRTKEIGIRKTMGASRGDILRLILWEFAKPVLWANLLAWPIGYFIMRRWLQGFAYHVNLEAWLFVAASAVAMAIAVATVAGHALLIARTEPNTALRYE